MDFLVGSSGSKHSPSMFPYQPPNLLRKNTAWFLFLLHCYMTSTSAKGYRDLISVCNRQLDNLILLLYSVIKMPCTSEHEGGEIRDKIWIYKDSVRNHSSILHEMSLQDIWWYTDMNTDGIHSPVSNIDMLRARPLLTVWNLRAQPNLSVTDTKQHHILSSPSLVFLVPKSHQTSWLQRLNFKFTFQLTGSKSH